jgi:hypothetical protein
VKETPQASVADLSQQSGVQSVLCILSNKFKILLKNLQDLFHKTINVKAVVPSCRPQLRFGLQSLGLPQKESRLLLMI